MAAWLAYLKSKLLLPTSEGEEEPSGAELAAALKAEGRRRAKAGSFFGYMAYAAMIARKS